MPDIYYRVEVEILVTSKQSGLKEQIEGEINIFCHRLEQLGSQSNHIYLHNHSVEMEE